MIKVTIKDKNITIKGHANHNKYGHDIVCAAVSSTVLCTINGILKINDDSIEVINKDGYISIDIIENNKITNILIQNMIDLLKILEKKYPKNITIKEE